MAVLAEIEVSIAKTPDIETLVFARVHFRWYPGINQVLCFCLNQTVILLRKGLGREKKRCIRRLSRHLTDLLSYSKIFRKISPVYPRFFWNRPLPTYFRSSFGFFRGGIERSAYRPILAGNQLLQAFTLNMLVYPVGFILSSGFFGGCVIDVRQLGFFCAIRPCSEQFANFVPNFRFFWPI